MDKTRINHTYEQRVPTLIIISGKNIYLALPCQKQGRSHKKMKETNLKKKEETHEKRT